MLVLSPYKAADDMSEEFKDFFFFLKHMEVLREVKEELSDYFYSTRFCRH